MWLMILTIAVNSHSYIPQTIVLYVESKEACVYNAKLIRENAEKVKPISDWSLTCRRPK